MSMMKKLLFPFMILFVSPLSVACSSTIKLADEELFVKAQSVFRARVIETKVVKFSNPENLSEIAEVIEAKFEVKEIYKGEPPRSGIVRDVPYGIGNCSLGLLAGIEYVFFPGDHDLILIYTGSFGPINSDGNEVKLRLDELRKLGKRLRQ